MRRAALAGGCHLALAGPVFAYSLTPTDTTFVSAGKAALSSGSLSGDCSVRFVGRTDAAGIGHITEARFSGGLLGGCGAIHATGLPWPMRAVAPGKAVIGVVSVSFFGDCAGRDVPVSLGAGGVIAFPHVALPPKCAMNGGLVVTRPPMRVVP